MKNCTCQKNVILITVGSYHIEPHCGATTSSQLEDHSRGPSRFWFFSLSMLTVWSSMHQNTKENDRRAAWFEISNTQHIKPVTLCNKMSHTGGHYEYSHLVNKPQRFRNACPRRKHDIALTNQKTDFQLIPHVERKSEVMTQLSCDVLQPNSWNYATDCLTGGF